MEPPNPTPSLDQVLKEMQQVYVTAAGTSSSTAGPSKWASKRPKRDALLVLNPITEEEWSHFDGKARWDSIVALRGPDLVHSETLKWFTSSVIRHRLSKVMRVGGMVNRILPCVVLGRNPGHIEGDTSSFDIHHFYGHIKEAAGWLNIPCHPCSDEAWEMILKGRSVSTVIDRLVTETEDPFKGFLLSIKGGLY